jgi:hypothetical protein
LGRNEAVVGKNKKLVATGAKQYRQLFAKCLERAGTRLCKIRYVTRVVNTREQVLQTFSETFTHAVVGGVDRELEEELLVNVCSCRAAATKPSMPDAAYNFKKTDMEGGGVHTIH